VTLRNDAAHDRVVYVDAWQTVVSTWNDAWVGQGLLDSLTKLKATLRGDLVQPPCDNVGSFDGP
jgi:hypothetical protein